MSTTTYDPSEHRTCPRCCGDGVVKTRKAATFASRVDSGYLVPNAPFREAFLSLKASEGLTYCELAQRLGESDKGTLVARSLGLRKWSAARGRGSYYAASMTSTRAMRLCEAMRLDPMDVGL